MKQADRTKARFAVIIGGEETARGSAKLKDLTTGEQKDYPLEALAGAIKNIK